MPTLYQLKPAFQRLLRPAAARLAGWGITANQITVLAAAISVGLGIALTTGAAHWLFLPPWLLLRMALNAVDGLLAREHNQASVAGALWNELGDALADAALLLPFAYLPGWNPLWVAVAAVLATITELTAVTGWALSGRRTNDGPLGKSDRALVLGVAGGLEGLGVHPHEAIAPAMTLLLVVTMIQRCRRILREAN